MWVLGPIDIGLQTSVATFHLQANFANKTAKKFRDIKNHCKYKINNWKYMNNSQIVCKKSTFYALYSYMLTNATINAIISMPPKCNPSVIYASPSDLHDPK